AADRLQNGVGPQELSLPGSYDIDNPHLEILPSSTSAYGWITLPIEPSLSCLFALIHKHNHLLVTCQPAKENTDPALTATYCTPPLV
ncbi:hypothetical protein GOODEAATRI_022549, partial [Goodea atripinnis]